MLRAYLLAIAVQIVAVHAVTAIRHARIVVPPFYGVATALGGFLFGVGMILAVGCAGAVLFRAGEGKLDYVLASVAYAVGVWAGTDWLAVPVRRALGGVGTATTLDGGFFLDQPVVLLLVAAAVVWWVMRGPRRPYQHGWDWRWTGVWLGVVAVAGWTVSALEGQASGLATSHGADRLATFFLERNVSALNWSVFLVVGIPAGSWIASRLHGASFESTFHAHRLPRVIGGGLLMGVGAAIAGGDNIAHGLSGMTFLAWASITFMIFVFAGVWCGTRLHWMDT